MKGIKNIAFIPLLAGIIFLGVASCEKDEELDTVPPGVVVVKEIIPTHGGAKITYTLPTDNELLFVKAKYVNSLGEEVFKSSSIYNDTIEIDGFNDLEEHTVELFAVDNSNNHSEPVIVKVTPLVSYINLVQESITIEPDLGGIKLEWNNVSAKTVHVLLIIEVESFKDSVYVSSMLENYQVNLRGLDSIDYDFYTMVEDFYGNKTEKKFNSTVKPKFEQKIEKDTWTLVSELSVNSEAYEGSAVNFWDDVIDTKESPDDNSYFMMSRDNNGGSLTYPMDIVIDLNKQVVVNRFVVWQRAFDYNNRTADNISEVAYYYQSENMRMFDLYTSNDKETWVLAGNFDIGDPKDDNGNISAEALQEALDGHMFELNNTTEPFRYLKFSVTSNYGSEQFINGSEITLYGLDNVQ